MTWSRALAPVVAALVAAAAPALASSHQDAGAGGSGADADASDGPALTVLVHHPHDGTDPLGFVYFAGMDYAQVRYAAAAGGRFDYPFLIADGVLPLDGIPDAARPYQSLLEAYTSLADERAKAAAPAAITLSSTLAEGSLVATVNVTPVQSLAESPHLRLAVVEDPVHYEPPAGLTNGIFDHRFTVRAVADLGPVELDRSSEQRHRFTLDPSWVRDRLFVAAWLQDDAGQGQFDPGEVLQATHARAGASVRQEQKGVLVEVVSATWCDPCRFGDLAVEELAVTRGAASPLGAAPTRSYLEPGPPLAVAAAVAAAALVAWRARP